MSVSVSGGVAAAARCLALDQAAAEVIGVLERADVPAVLLKGAGLARRLYPDHPDRRRYSDVDVLVSPASFDQAQRVLAEHGLLDVYSGWRANEWQWRERSWRLPGPGLLTVDLHRSFAGVDDPAAFWDVISGAAEPFELWGATVRVPDAAGCALIVGLHAARPGNGRKALTDLVTALALLPDAVWDEAAELARQTRATDAFARGLCLDPAGAALSRRLALTARGTLTDDLLARQVDGVVLSLAKLADQSSPWATVRLTASRLVPSTAWMRYNWPLARRGTLGLVASYGVRVAGIAGRTPRAVLDLRRARRDHGPVRRRPLAWRQRRRLSRVLRRVRAVADLSWRDRLTGGWTVLALRLVRAQLVDAPLDQVSLPVPPPAGPGGESTVTRVLTYRGASCMETALVRQRWLAAQGIAHDLLIGVSAPGQGFRAHAWLEEVAAGGRHEHQHSDPTSSTGLMEIHRRPTPAKWLSGGHTAPDAATGAAPSSP